MNNVHLWQYLVIAGPAAILGGLVVWALNREYTRGLEDVVLSDMKPMPAPEFIVPMHTVGRCHSAYLTWWAACQAGKRALYRGPGYVVIPDAMYEELTDSRRATDKTRRVAGYMMGMDPGRPEGSVDAWRQP